MSKKSDIHVEQYICSNNEFTPEELAMLPKRVGLKIVLVHAFDKVWNKLDIEKAHYPSGCLSLVTKSFKKDLKKGLKIINKKVPLYIELPDYSKVGNGMYKVASSSDSDENVEVSAETMAMMETTRRVTKK